MGVEGITKNRFHLVGLNIIQVCCVERLTVRLHSNNKVVDGERFGGGGYEVEDIGREFFLEVE